MKTKAQINAQINDLRSRAYNRSDTAYREILKHEIRTLRWVLGHKLENMYWCTYCQKAHQNLKCPKCGDTTDLG